MYGSGDLYKRKLLIRQICSVKSYERYRYDENGENKHLFMGKI